MSRHAIPELIMGDESQIHQGDARKIRAVTTNASDAQAEPTQLKIRVTAPSRTIVTYAKAAEGEEKPLIREEDGNYYAEHTFTEGGWHEVIAVGSGNMAEVEPANVYVVSVPGAP